MDTPPKTKQRPEPERVDRNTDETRSIYSSSSPIAKRYDYVGQSSLGERARASHQRLFGKGAKVSGGMEAFEESRKANSMDEAAYAYRPRAADAGKDINLPKSPTKKKAPTKGLSPSKKR